LKSESIFQEPGGNDRWNDFNKRVVQHNLRVMALYYTRITTTRLAQLLQLSEEKSELYLSEMVSSKQLYAKIDRPAGIVRFAKKQTPAETMNTWSVDIGEILTLIDRTCHLINKENMLQHIEEVSVGGD